MKLLRRNFTVNDLQNPDVPGRVDQYLDLIQSAVDGRIDKDQAFITTSPATAGDEFRITHNLGFIPNNFLVVSKSGAGEIYPSGTAWTESTAFLKCTTASLSMRVLIW